MSQLDKWSAFGEACEARVARFMSTWECKQNGRGDCIGGVAVQCGGVCGGRGATHLSMTNERRGHFIGSRAQAHFKWGRNREILLRCHLRANFREEFPLKVNMGP